MNHSSCSGKIKMKTLTLQCFTCIMSSAYSFHLPWVHTIFKTGTAGSRGSSSTGMIQSRYLTSNPTSSLQSSSSLSITSSIAWQQTATSTASSLRRRNVIRRCSSIHGTNDAAGIAGTERAATADDTAFDFDTLPDRKDKGSLKWIKYEGKDIIPLWVADMDLHTAPVILDALKNYIHEHGIFGYTMPTEEVKQAVVSYMKRQGAVIDSKWVFFSPGVVQSLNLVCKLADPGAGIMVFTPIYASFLHAPPYTDRELVTVQLKLGEVEVEGRGGAGTIKKELHTFDFDAMDKARWQQGNVKVLLLCNPHNPYGRVFTRQELSELGQWCEKHDIIICSDEIHCDLVLSGRDADEDGADVGSGSGGGGSGGDFIAEHVNFLTLEDGRYKARTILLNAPSKTFNVAGLGCSYAVIANDSLRRAFNLAARGIITQNPTLGYVGLTAAYNLGMPWNNALIKHLRKNRDIVYAYVSERLPELTIRPMEATYLYWVDVSRLGWRDPVLTFENYGVGFTDGRFFAGDQCVRINFGCPTELLKEGLRRMENAVVNEYRMKQQQQQQQQQAGPAGQLQEEEEGKEQEKAAAAGQEVPVQRHP